MEALDLPGPDAISDDRELDPRLGAILDAGFEDIGGCIVLARFAESARGASPADLGDETGLEAFVNHLHIDDELASAAESEVLIQAVLFVRRLARELSAAYPDDAFEIVLAFSDSCTVRFHRSRPGQSWLANDIESYDEALLWVFVRARN